MSVVKSLSGSISSLVEDDLLVGDMMMEADDLLRRLSTYATLRPGDLPALVGSSRSHPGRKLASSQSLLLQHEDRIIRERRDSASSDEFAESENSGPVEEEIEIGDIVVRGKHIGEHPVEYTVRGIWPHEMPVIGLYVDPRILPGFRYRVRRLVGTDQYLFQGRALTLQSIGLGYGKRLTFEGEKLNFNDNYFWSDSEPNGFAFSLEAVRPGDTLAIYGNGGSGVVGEVRVERVEGHQGESSTEVLKGDVIKRARVTATCSVTYFVPRHHGRLNVKLQSVERVSGEATVVRRRGQRQAALDCVYGVQLARLPGTCTLQNEA